ncbi:LacI family DNA-binding transcriptional regulator [Bifidobacterium vansinderenii]|uniref:LacI family transcriptional regulator n=1 Tax=Bifidobacterium vansinderenii TaxID=1984871 RepID=A0A229VX11_9BIFI|nr:LacI family DNA-binding transcriptional regulator [Bifidobacterium vansinderenii]OXN00161.1 LacI family transcriptional regulator [Bifidobacterium vansinderenii]
MSNDDHSAATIWDVAQAAGVSIATVSRAFRQPNRVNARTLERVRQAADRLGYHTDLVEPVRTDDERLRGLISLVVSDLENPAAAQLARAVQKQCESKNFGLLIADSEGDVTRELAIVHRSLAHVDGVILGSSRLSDAAIRKAAQIKPLISQNRQVGGVKSIVVDEGPALAEAVDALYRLGHRSLTYLSGPDRSWQNGLRRNAVMRACESCGMAFQRIRVVDPVERHRKESFSQFMERPTGAVIAFNDAVAMEFILFLIDNGIRVPRDVSVVGVDDVPMSRLFTPSLTTIGIPRRETGRLAATTLIGQILHTEVIDAAPISVGATFVPRNSIGPAPDHDGTR